MPTTEASNTWVLQPTLTVNGKPRTWWVWLPTNYDAMRAYPLVFSFQGCGATDNIVPMQKVTGANAIVVRAATNLANNCYNYSATGDDVLFFDALLAKLTASRCIDTGRVFAAGYSSGSWLINTLTCVRGDKFRAVGTVSGGTGGTGTCIGKFARTFIHDADDTSNRFIQDGNLVERTRLLAQNHCDTTLPPVPEPPPPCARYQGCDAGYPIIMCQTTKQGHSREDTMAPDAFWRLFSSL